MASGGREMGAGEATGGLGGLAVGQSVVVSTDSVIYRGQYSSTVVGVDDEFVRVSVPTDRGWVVLVPAGTGVTVRAETEEGPLVFESRVVDRLAGHGRCLVLARPDAKAKEEPAEEESTCEVVTIASGKGGVGKTTLAVNLGIALCLAGKRVCVMDADLGTANVDVLLNLAPRFNVSDLVAGRKRVFEVLVEGPNGLVILPGGSGLQELTSLDERQFGRLLAEFRQVEKYMDIIIIDTGGGLARNVTTFMLAAKYSVVVTTPEPHAVTDAYALIKVLTRQGRNAPLRLVVNRARSASEAEDISRKMVFAARRFLQFDLEPLGYVLEDEAVPKAIRRQVDFVTQYPKSKASECVRGIAAEMGRTGAVEARATGLSGFVQRLKALLPRGG
ncbi:MAG: AAA family ATPase [Firmicutes bacterium]|nr:AAA family ATPase [Bacillota bacterium]